MKDIDGVQYLECSKGQCDFAVGHLPPVASEETIVISCFYDAEAFFAGEDVPPECLHKQAVYGLVHGELRRN